MNTQVATDLPAVVRRTRDFLLATQSAEGAWSDFLLPAGSSNLWVTAYVGQALGSSADESSVAAAHAGWRFLTTANHDDGWSYNPSVPNDADSTLWGLRLAQSIGEEGSRHACLAAAFLDAHVQPDDGLSTYRSAEEICRFIGLPPLFDFSGWTGSHVCVTAAGANLERYRQRCTQYLLDRQADDGSWPAYWWMGSEYATAEAVAALCDLQEAADCIAKAITWASRRCRAIVRAKSDDTTAFQLAQILRILTHGRNTTEEIVSAGVEYLCGIQRPDGSWRGSAYLRVPPPPVITPRGDDNWKQWAGLAPGEASLEQTIDGTFNIYSPDHYRVFTTATALKALGEVRRAYWNV